MKFGPRWIQPVWILCLSSMVTGLATGPIAAAHFNIAAQYGLVDNLVYVPLMGVVIMPTGVVALLLMPFELDGVALSVMGLGLDWILTVADWVSHLEKAVIFVKAPSPVFLPLMAFSGLFLVLWIGSFRAVGVLGIVVASVFWGGNKPPCDVDQRYRRFDWRANGQRSGAE
jgi:competence protein ComEC